MVPELCNMTGLSDEQRANFKLMQDMGAFTRQDPVKRTQTLKKFSEKLNTNPQVSEDMKAWNLALGKESPSPPLQLIADIFPVLGLPRQIVD